jgi:hypothetical protein
MKTPRGGIDGRYPPLLFYPQKRVRYFIVLCYQRDEINCLVRDLNIQRIGHFRIQGEHKPRIQGVPPHPQAYPHKTRSASLAAPSKSHFLESRCVGPRATARGPAEAPRQRPAPFQSASFPARAWQSLEQISDFRRPGSRMCSTQLGMGGLCTCIQTININ